MGTSENDLRKRQLDWVRPVFVDDMIHCWEIQYPAIRHVSRLIVKSAFGSRTVHSQGVFEMPSRVCQARCGVHDADSPVSSFATEKLRLVRLWRRSLVVPNTGCEPE
jgi:hypothetical protein